MIRTGISRVAVIRPTCHETRGKRQPEAQAAEAKAVDWIVWFGVKREYVAARAPVALGGAGRRGRVVQ
jgi:hypothetical protein